MFEHNDFLSELYTIEDLGGFTNTGIYRQVQGELIEEKKRLPNINVFHVCLNKEKEVINYVIQCLLKDGLVAEPAKLYGIDDTYLVTHCIKVTIPERKK